MLYLNNKFKVETVNKVLKNILLVTNVYTYFVTNIKFAEEDIEIEEEIDLVRMKNGDKLSVQIRYFI